VEIEENFLNFIENICKNLQKHHTWWKTLFGSKAKKYSLTILTQHCARNPGHSNKAGNEKKSIWIIKEQIKPSLFADDGIIYIEISENL
jgi:hypothetical protein